MADADIAIMLWFKTYTLLTTVNPNFSTIGFTNLQLLRKQPF